MAGVSDADAVLYPVSRYVDALQQIELSKQQVNPHAEVLFALVTGVPSDYQHGGKEITYADAVAMDEQIEHGVGAGCVDSSFDPPWIARPPVRELELAQAFELRDYRNAYSICVDEYLEVLTPLIPWSEGPRAPCMRACVADTNAETPELEPDCVVEHHVLPLDGTARTQVPRCDAQGELPDGVDECWHPRVDDSREDDLDTRDDMSEQCVASGWNLEIGLRWRDFDAVPGGSSYSATCIASERRHLDCPLLP